MSKPEWDIEKIKDLLRRQRRWSRMTEGHGEAMKQAEAELAAEDDEQSNEVPRPPVVETNLFRELTRPATEARLEAKQRNVDRARQLKHDGLSPAQIAVRMTADRDDPQRPPINQRTVQRWLKERET